MTQPLPGQSEKPLKAYYVTFKVEEECTALVLAHNADEARQKFNDGEQEWTQASGEAWRRYGARSIRRAPKEDPE